MKKRVIAALVLALGVLMCACGGRNGGNSLSMNENDRAIAYLSEKYAEPFTYYGGKGDSLYGAHELLAECESLKGRQVLVRVGTDKDKNTVYSDNYVAVKYEDEVRKYIAGFFADSFSKVNVFYDVTMEALPDTVRPEMSLEDYLAADGPALIASIEVNASDYTGKDQIDALAKEMASRINRLYFSVFVAKDADFYSGDDFTVLRDRRNKNDYDAYVEYELQGGEVQSEWKDK